MDNLPQINVNHLLRLTDSTGIIQHANYALPNLVTGYTTDDNARALITCVDLYRRFQDKVYLDMSHTYLSFLLYAQKNNGKWHNFVHYDRSFADEEGSEDSFGRAVWALGHLIEAWPEHYLGQVARSMLERALPWVENLSYARAKAFALIGICCYASTSPGSRLLATIQSLASWFSQQLDREDKKGWKWFEPTLTYSNAVLVTGLLQAFKATGIESYWKAAHDALGFLTELHFQRSYLKLVGNHGWCRRGQEPAVFDEQPEDAGCLVQAYTLASRLSHSHDYPNLAHKAFKWFLGENIQGLALYDPETGGCCDGLTVTGVNQNQGAESLLAYLESRLAVETLEIKSSGSTETPAVAFKQ